MDYNITATVPNIIAILTIFGLAIGGLYYAGVYKRLQEEYHLKTLKLSFKNQLLIVGAIFLFSILFSVIIYVFILQIFQNYWVGLILLLLILIILLLIVNYFIYKLPMKKQENKNNFESLIAFFLVILIVIAILDFIITSQQNVLFYVTNYMLVVALLLILFGYMEEKNRYKNNNIILKMIDSNTPIEDLELFDITDNDYRFKKIDGTELIVPIGQVREIISNTEDSIK